VIAALKNCNPDGAVIVTTPQDLSVDMIKREINFCNKMKLPIIGIIENMYVMCIIIPRFKLILRKGFSCPCCGEVTNILDSKESIAERIPDTRILGSIPMDEVCFQFVLVNCANV
jgi:hypothetical protein